MLNHTKLINRIIASMFIVHCLWRQNQYNKLEVRLTNWFVSIMRFLYMVYRHNCANKIMCTNISDEYRLIFTFSKRHIHFVCLWRVFVARVMQIGNFASLFLHYISILCFVCGYLQFAYVHNDNSRRGFAKLHASTWLHGRTWKLWVLRFSIQWTRRTWWFNWIFPTAYRDRIIL